jgi:hypothetical protein
MQTETRMPWGPEEEVAAATAVNSLQHLLLNAAKDQRGVHVETMMTIAGALAGFSAQHAIRETVVKTGKLPESGGRNLNGGAFVVVSTANGETYYFGDLLNSYLIPQNHPLGPGQYTLWSFLAAAVQDSGGKPLSPQEVGEIFKNSTATAGSPQFGVPRLPEAHRPRWSPREALNAFWPLAVEALSSEANVPGRKGQRLAPSHWPAAIALTAQKLIKLSKEALDPALSMRIVLEAAVPMSKVDPKTVPQELAKK